MKQIISIVVLFLPPIIAFAQIDEAYLEKLKIELRNATSDTVRMDIKREIGLYLQDGTADAALPYHQAQLALAQKLKLKLWEADAYQQMAYCNWWMINYPESFEYYENAMGIAQDPASSENTWRYDKFSFSKSPEDARESIIGMIHYEQGGLYGNTRQFDESLRQYREGLFIGEKLHNKKILSLCSRNIGLYYLNNNNLDSAFFYFQKSLSHFNNSPYQKSIGFLYQLLGSYYLQKQQLDSAKMYMGMAIKENSKLFVLNSLDYEYNEIGKLFTLTGQLDSALYYTYKGIQVAETAKDNSGKVEGYTSLASIYAMQNKYQLSYDYLLKAKTISDSQNEAYITKLMQFQNMGFDQKMRLQELEKESQQTKNRVRIYALLIGLGIILLAALFLYRNNRQKQKTNKVLEAALHDLKATQTQLVHAEKMASLGELTAGIAHEIQNPLNFVNNFAEINNELIDEMQAENNLKEVMTIVGDIRQNNEKISEHGKRADAIVKSMLQHSRSSSGKKEPTDINALCDEYLRLAYHGLRAKDKSFNVTLKTGFDESIGKINIIPQDMGRVILNLINNSFYAVDEKKKACEVEPEKAPYQPTVSVSTKRINGKVEITVSDNGNGIPQVIVDKIFQPFFTTKPTGQGTGLGLSLSYDIVKAHGGEIIVTTKGQEEQTAEQAGTIFTIVLPAR